MNSYLIYNYITKKKYKIKSNIFIRYSWSTERDQFFKAIADKLYPNDAHRIVSVQRTSDGTGKGRNHPSDNWHYTSYHCYDYDGNPIPNTRFTVKYLFKDSVDKSQKKCKIIWENK